jgi:glutaredoxin
MTQHDTPPEVVVYSRQGCHLCEQALDRLRRLGNELTFELRVVDVDAEPALAERYGATAPVVAVDGVEVSAGRLDRAAVRRALRQAGALTVDSTVDSSGARS